MAQVNSSRADSATSSRLSLLTKETPILEFAFLLFSGLFLLFDSCDIVAFKDSNNKFSTTVLSETLKSDITVGFHEFT